MKHTYDQIRKRRKELLKFLEFNLSPNIDAIAQKMNTSSVTIRRDLLWLEDHKYIDRSGLGIVVKNSIQPLTNIFSSSKSAEKRAIAKRAASFVENGDTIFINSSSTALLMLDYIQATQVTIITNNLKVLFVDAKETMSIILTGGEIRNPKESLVGEFATNNISNIKATKCFLGCSGISVDGGFTTAVLQEVSVNKDMIRNTIGKKYILADYSKVSKTHSFKTCDINQVDCIITDGNVNPQVVSTISQAGIKVIISE